MNTKAASKPVNPNRISVAEWKEDNGIEDSDALYERLSEMSSDGVCDALCRENCQVEPDGRCSHGCPSVLIAMGLI